MASPPSSPSLPDAEAPPPPTSPSTVTGGAVSGTIPAAEAFAVHYPGYPSSPARAAQTLGGLPAIAKVRGSDPGARLELRFRPEDPYCHPAFGEPRMSAGLVLRLSRPKGGTAPPRAEVVARVRNAYHFEDNEDAMMLVPPLFSIKDKPTKIALLPSSNALSKSMQRGVVQHRWEMDIGPTLALPFNVQDILFYCCPVKLLFRAGYYFSTGPFGKFWIRRGYDPRKDPDSRMSSRVTLLGKGGRDAGMAGRSANGRIGEDERRQELGLCYQWRRDGQCEQPSCRLIRFQRIDFRMPPELRNLPRKERRPEKWTEMCKLEVMPSKSFIFLQLFELKDDFIQAEIRKPSHQPTCSHLTGWFCKPMIKTLRLQLSIRLFSLCPNEDAKNFLRNAYELIERSKKQEALCRSQQLKENKEASDRHNGTEDQAGGNNSDSEDAEDDEEEDKESDGYESPPMADDVPDFTLDDPYTSGEGFSNGYLEEMLRNFPLHEDGQNKPGDAPNNTEASDGEFEIYEQPSDDEESSDG
uniref:Transcription factor IIIC subunit Tfc1/Sfc1 triple barrel domain-containing protein n=1 Tax=Oryza glumipatula TaxID=40148 RepID=A0A0D9Y9X4_9ORYZ